MSEEQKVISKITLSNGKTYVIKDPNALHISESGIVTGDIALDGYIKVNKLYIISIEDMLEVPSNVLVQDDLSQEIKRRSTSRLLEDIGGYSCDESTLEDGILTLKLGK